MMASQTLRQSNKNRRKNSTQAIEKAAVRFFVERGYRSTSIDLIAREVGMTKGTIYFYFKDKETLLLNLLSKSQEHFFSQIFKSMDSYEDDPKLQIDVFLDQMIRAGVEIDKYLLLLPVLMSTEFNGRENTIALRARAIYDHVYTKITDIIAKGQQSGYFSNHSDPRALATMIVALTDGLLIEIYRSSSGVSGKIIGQTARIAIHSLLEFNITSNAK